MRKEMMSQCDENACKPRCRDPMDVRYARWQNALAEAGDEEVVSCADEVRSGDYEAARYCVSELWSGSGMQARQTTRDVTYDA